ncbi:MAG: PepSY domain-containing protein [Nitrosomonas sp.]|nr:PepSY domain-containing protein [Nitrosomonas sp.]
MQTLLNILLIIILLSGPVQQVIADSKSLSQQEAVNIAQQHIEGRVLAIKHIDNTYRIKILSSQGTVHILLINAANGLIVSADK